MLLGFLSSILHAFRRQEKASNAISIGCCAGCGAFGGLGKSGTCQGRLPSTSIDVYTVYHAAHTMVTYYIFKMYIDKLYGSHRHRYVV